MFVCTELIKVHEQLNMKMRTEVYSGTPLNRPPLGPVKVSLLEGWPHFRGDFVLKSMLWDFSKWPEYRGGHISGVLIRGVPLYNYFDGCLNDKDCHKEY